MPFLKFYKRVEVGSGGMEILAELTQEIGLTAVLLLGAGIYFYRMSISDRQDRRDAERFNKEQTILFTEAVSDFKTVIHENNGIMGANQDIVVHNQLILEQNTEGIK